LAIEGRWLLQSSTHQISLEHHHQRRDASFLSFLEGELLTFLFMLAFAIFVETSIIGLLWACSEKGNHRLSLLD